jgi:hypothetical protein
VIHQTQGHLTPGPNAHSGITRSRGAALWAALFVFVALRELGCVSGGSAAPVGA